MTVAKQRGCKLNGNRLSRANSLMVAVCSLQLDLHHLTFELFCSLAILLVNLGKQNLVLLGRENYSLNKGFSPMLAVK